MQFNEDGSWRPGADSGVSRHPQSEKFASSGHRLRGQEARARIALIPRKRPQSLPPPCNWRRRGLPPVVTFRMGHGRGRTIQKSSSRSFLSRWICSASAVFQPSMSEMSLTLCCNSELSRASAHHIATRRTQSKRLGACARFSRLESPTSLVAQNQSVHGAHGLLFYGRTRFSNFPECAGLTARTRPQRNACARRQQLLDHCLLCCRQVAIL